MSSSHPVEKLENVQLIDRRLARAHKGQDLMKVQSIQGRAWTTLGRPAQNQGRAWTTTKFWARPIDYPYERPRKLHLDDESLYCQPFMKKYLVNPQQLENVQNFCFIKIFHRNMHGERNKHLSHIIMKHPPIAFLPEQACLQLPHPYCSLTHLLQVGLHFANFF